MNESKKRSPKQWDRWRRSGAIGTMENARSQKTMVNAMAELETLDFTNLSAVIGWFEQIREATDRHRPNYYPDQIIATFLSKGYTLTQQRSDYGCDDEERFARYIVAGQLVLLKSVGHAHQIFDFVMKEWRTKFNHPRARRG